MKIIVNTRLLLPHGLDGIGWFSYETLKRICTKQQDHDFIFLFDRKYEEKYIFSSNITPIIAWPQARHPFLFYIWFEKSLPYIFKKEKAQLFLSPDGYISLKSSIKTHAVIHDINFESHPNDLPWLIRKYYRHYFPQFAHKATRISTVSEFSKQDICKTYNIAPEKIDVVYNGASGNYKPLNELEKKEIQDKYSCGIPYFIFIGSLHPRKNIANLFKAFELFCKSTENKANLIIVGDKMWWNSDIKNTYNKLTCKDKILFTGWLPQPELSKVLGGALALTYVSYFEGFGIPIIEAMNCDVPVITSNLTSMPEVAGEAALLIDPFQPESIKNAMLQIYNNKKLRNELILKGQNRRNNFSWDKTADLLWQSIEKTINTKP